MQPLIAALAAVMLTAGAAAQAQTSTGQTPKPITMPAAPMAAPDPATLREPAAAAVPAAIKSWMLLAIGTLKAQTETLGDTKQASLPDRFWHRLLDPYRIYEAN